jgi:hypothetical protein
VTRGAQSIADAIRAGDLARAIELAEALVRLVTPKTTARAVPATAAAAHALTTGGPEGPEPGGQSNGRVRRRQSLSRYRHRQDD